MPIYHYKGIDGTSKSIKGIVDAESEKAARAKLRKQKIYPTQLTLEKSARATKTFSGQPSSTDIAQMTRQIAILLNAQIPLVEALGGVQEQMEHPVLRKALADIREKVSEGARFWESTKAYPEIFDSIFVNMVKAGEASGSLELILTRLADYKENQVALLSKVKSALIYPAIMITLSLGMMVFLFGFVIPEMARLFEKQKVALPRLTQVVLSISHLITEKWPVLLILIALSVIFFRSYIRSKKGRIWLDDYKLKVPIFGKVNQKVIVARFSRTLSTLLSSGVQLIQGLEIVRELLNNVVLAEVINNTIARVKEGEPLSDTLRQSGKFPQLFLHMLAIGEKTGMLEQMLNKISDTYDLESKNAIESMTSLITPLLVIVMGIVVALVVFAVLMPIMQLGNAAQF